MGLIDRLAGEPNYDGMPEPEPPLPCFVCGDPADHELRDTGGLDYGVCHAHRGHEPLAHRDVSWDRPTEELGIGWQPAPPPVLHQWVSAEPKLRVKLERGMKGTYAWEISYEARDADALVPALSDMDDRLRALYGGQP